MLPAGVDMDKMFRFRPTRSRKQMKRRKERKTDQQRGYQASELESKI